MPKKISAKAAQPSNGNTKPNPDDPMDFTLTKKKISAKTVAPPAAPTKAADPSKDDGDKKPAAVSAALPKKTDDKKKDADVAGAAVDLVDTDEEEPEPPKRNGPVDMAYSPNKKSKAATRASRADKICVTLFQNGMALFEHTKHDQDVEAYQYDAKEDLKLSPNESSLKKRGFLGFVQIKGADGTKKKCKHSRYPATGFVGKVFDSPKEMKLYSKAEIKDRLFKWCRDLAMVRQNERLASPSFCFQSISNHCLSSLLPRSGSWTKLATNMTSIARSETTFGVTKTTARFPSMTLSRMPTPCSCSDKSTETRTAISRKVSRPATPRPSSVSSATPTS